MAWMTSEWCSTWHVVDRVACGRVVVSTCGHPLVGRMSRVLSGPLPADSRAVCQACVAVTGACAESDSTRAAVLATALDALAGRGSLCAPGQSPPESASGLRIEWPCGDPPDQAVHPGRAGKLRRCTGKWLAVA